MSVSNLIICNFVPFKPMNHWNRNHNLDINYAGNTASVVIKLVISGALPTKELVY